MVGKTAPGCRHGRVTPTWPLRPARQLTVTAPGLILGSNEPMRALFATALACLALAACGRAEQLPPGMASRVSAPADVFSVAVPAGWLDLGSHGPQETTGPTGLHTWSLGPTGGVPLRTPPPGMHYPSPNPIPTPAPGWGPAGLAVLWTDDLRPGGISGTEIDTAPVTIAGESVATQSDGITSLGAHFQHEVAGRAEQFFVSCPYEVPRDNCVALLTSWRWETPSSSHTVFIVASTLCGGSVIVAGLALVAVRRTRWRRAPQ